MASLLDHDGPHDGDADSRSSQRDRHRAIARDTDLSEAPSSQTSSSNSDANFDNGVGHSKGKGKAIPDGDTSTNSPHPDGTETRNDFALQRTREDLQLLAAMDPAMASKLVALDPTPTDQLPTTTKLMKAISILAGASSLSQDMNFDGAARSSVPFPDVLELLASALSDVSQTYPDMRARPKPISLHHLEIARAKLSLPLQDAVPPSARSGSSPALIAVTPSGHPILIGELAAPPSEAALLYAENARLALCALRPSALFPTPRYDYPSRDSPSSMYSPASRHSGPSPIAVLPSELLLFIFQFAHAAASEPIEDTTTSVNSTGRTPPIVTEVWAGRGRRTIRDEYGNPVNRLSGSKAAAQRFALALARVCKSWLEPARTVAFRHIFIDQGPQLADLLSSLTGSPSLSRAASSILAISATLAPPGSNEAPSSSGGPSVSLNRMLGRLTTRRGRPSTTLVSFGGGRSNSETEGGSSGGVKREEGKTPAEMWSQIVDMCPNVKDLKLKILPSSNRWAGFSRSPSTTEFLDAAVLGTLSSTRGLRNLNLAFSIDFEELEVIMNGLPNLESVSIRAIEAISGSAAVNSTGPHPARNIRYFKLGDSNSNSPYNIQEYTSISDVQLAWILEPAVANSALSELEVSILIDPGVGGGWPPGVPGGPPFGANANAPPFASSTIADLLVRCGENLERLVLQDLAEAGSVNPNFVAAPHNSNFDHVLSALTRLRDLSLQFSYTGAGFLEALSSVPHLRHLSLSGTPVHTSADLFAAKLEGGPGLGELESLTISGQFAGTRGGQGGWNGAGVRRVKQAAKERGLQGAFGG